ncbi:ankyrin repeat domain-containing protein [Arcobacteraceae bacterium]|nr:ankyrin repeat domain-containing protein [Arcobacteraceae bacterium]
MNEIENLLLSGADVNTSDKNNFTLLMNFVNKGNFETVKLLLRYGANVNIKDNFHFTALDYAIRKGYLKIVKLLVTNGALITDDSYMFALESKHKELVDFFDSLDPNKYIFLKDKMK